MTQDKINLELAARDQWLSSPREAFASDPKAFVEGALEVLLDSAARARHLEAWGDEGASEVEDLDELLDGVYARGLEALSPRQLVSIFESRRRFVALGEALDVLDAEVEAQLADMALEASLAAPEVAEEPPQVAGSPGEAQAPAVVTALAPKRKESVAKENHFGAWLRRLFSPGPVRSRVFALAIILLSIGAFVALSLYHQEPLDEAFEAQKEERIQDAPEVIEEPTTVADAWSGQIEREQVVGGGIGLTLEGAEQGALEVEPGARLATDATSRARVRMVDGSELVLDHGTQVDLDNTQGRQAEVLSGQALFSVWPASIDAKVDTPHGRVTTGDAKFSVFAGERETLVTVSRGTVNVHSTQAGHLQVRAGEEVILLDEGRPKVSPSLDLGGALGWAALEDDASIQVPRGLGTLVAKKPGDKKTEYPLQLKEHHVEVKVQGLVARTEITETFYNDSDETLEGIFEMPLPADAQISELRLLVGDTWMEGEFVESARADKIWRGVIHNATGKKAKPRGEEIIWVPGRWKDPALLKWQQGDTFELRIYPIEPKSERKVVLSYTQRLSAAPGGRVYTYPMPVDEEGEQRVGSFRFNATVFGHDPSRELLVSGVPAALEVADASAKVHYEAKDFAAAGDLRIRFQIEGGERELRTVSYRDPARPEEDGYVAMALRPLLPRAERRRDNDVVVVIDRSHSVTGIAAQKQVQLLERLISEMTNGDRVAVLACSTLCHPVGVPGLQPVVTRSPKDLAGALSGFEPAGTTNMEEMLRVGDLTLALEEGEGRAAHLLIFSDGETSAGETSIKALTELVNEHRRPRRLSVVDLGGGGDAKVQRALADAGGGDLIKLDPAMGRSAQVLSILSRVYQPTLEDAVLTLPEGLTKVEPHWLGNLFAGEERVIVARAADHLQGELSLRGRYDGKPFERRFPLRVELSEGGGNAFVPRLWAEARIRSLEQGGVSLVGALVGEVKEVDEEEARSEIVALSLRHGLLSRYTALLALESEAMMRAFDLKRVQRPVWTGEEAAIEALAGESIGGGGGSLGALDGLAKGSGTTSGAKSSSGLGMGKSIDNSAEVGLGIGGTISPMSEVARPRSQGSFQRRVKVADIAKAKKKTSSKAVEKARLAVSQSPDARHLRVDLVKALSLAAMHDEALVAVDEWIERDRMDTDAWLWRAEILARQGDRLGALRALAAAVETSPRSAELQERIGAAYEYMGLLERACPHFKASAQLRGERFEVACGVASSLTWVKDMPPRGPVALPERTKKRGSGMVATLTWQGDAELDLFLLDPSGRGLGWISNARDLVIERSQETKDGVLKNTLKLRLPYLGRGTWRVEAVRMDEGEPVDAKLKLKALKSKESEKLKVGEEPVVALRAKVSKEWRTVSSHEMVSIRVSAKKDGEKDQQATNYMKRFRTKFKYCVEKGAQRSGSFRVGTERITIVVEGGRVVKSRNFKELGDANISNCMERLVRRSKLPEDGTYEITVKLK